MTSKLNYTAFGARIRSLGDATLEAQKRAVSEAALILKRSIEQQTSIAMRGDMVFSNMDTVRKRNGQDVPSKSPARLRVGYDLVGDNNPTALLVGRGPWGLIEYGSDPHFITPRMPTIQRKRVARLKYQQQVKQRQYDIMFGAKSAFSGLSPLNGAAGGGTPRYRVYHKGTKGKKPFSRGISIAQDIAARRARTLITNEVIQTIRTNGVQYLNFRNNWSKETEVRTFEVGLR